MSNKEFSEKLKAGIELAGKRMLQEKAMRGEDIIVCDADNNIQRIPASQVMLAEQALCVTKYHGRG